MHDEREKNLYRRLATLVFSVYDPPKYPPNLIDRLKPISNSDGYEHLRDSGWFNENYLWMKEWEHGGQVIPVPSRGRVTGMGESLKAVIYKVPSERAIYIVFRGSKYFENWFYNLTYFDVELKPIFGIPDKSVRVHMGFQDAYLALRDEIFESIKELTLDGVEYVYYLGHSLGGAMASLASLDFTRSLKQVYL